MGQEDRQEVQYHRPGKKEWARNQGAEKIGCDCWFSLCPSRSTLHPALWLRADLYGLHQLSHGFHLVWPMEDTCRRLQSRILFRTSSYTPRGPLCWQWLCSLSESHYFNPVALSYGSLLVLFITFCLSLTVPAPSGLGVVMAPRGVL